jgi:hypothetical protein
MDKAKIILSAKETELVTNSDWILTKNEILKKVKWLLEDVQARQQQYLNAQRFKFPSEVVSVPPKISKGENYRGLPYLVLDYPRVFGKEDHFAIRTMFWWGNFFSVTLHIGGAHKIEYEPKISRSFTLLKDAAYFTGVSDDQWEHHFETSNYVSLREMDAESFKGNIASKNFIKLAKHFSLVQWGNAGDNLFTSFCQLIQLLGS